MHKCEITLKASQSASVTIKFTEDERSPIWTTDEFRVRYTGQGVLSSGIQVIGVEYEGANHDNLENLFLRAHFETESPKVSLFFECTEKAEATVNGKPVDNFSTGELYQFTFSTGELDQLPKYHDK